MIVAKKKKQLPLPLYEEVKHLNESLFNEQLDWETPEYISRNMVHTFRYYQDAALRFFHYSQTDETFRFRNVNHVLFNMATCSGKTDLMAGLILYLYQEHGYQNFLFLVNTNGVLSKTRCLSIKLSHLLFKFDPFCLSATIDFAFVRVGVLSTGSLK